MIAAFYEAVARTMLHWITGWFVYPALFYCGACVLSKRLHDRGRSGWWAALVLLARGRRSGRIRTASSTSSSCSWLVWAGVDLGAMPGEAGTNRYGPNPHAPTPSRPSEW